jgi:hypothetical protein
VKQDVAALEDGNYDGTNHHVHQGVRNALFIAPEVSEDYNKLVDLQESYVTMRADKGFDVVLIKVRT